MHIQFEAYYQCPSSPGQHIAEQHSAQPKHARAAHNWVNAIAHWSFILVQHWMQHMQQQWLHILPQQFEAAFMNISAASGNFASPYPGGMFSVVAVMSPNPIPRLYNNIFLKFFNSTTFSGSLLFDICSNLLSKILLVGFYIKWFGTNNVQKKWSNNDLLALHPNKIFMIQAYLTKKKDAKLGIPGNWKAKHSDIRRQFE